MKRFILAMFMAIVSAFVVNAETKKSSPWTVIQAVEIPSNVTIHEGTTRGGNPKFWIEVSGISVSVSEGNAKKFKSGDVKLELVKWQNTETKKFKYSTRQIKGSSSPKAVKDVDLKGVF